MKEPLGPSIKSTELRFGSMTNFLERLTLAASTLRPSEKKVAQFITDHLRDAARSPITEMARHSGTSESTVNRLSRSLGYEGYADMRIALASLPADGSTPIHNIPRDIKPDDNLNTICEKLAQSLASALSGTLQTLSTTEIQRTIESMIQAERVLMFGIGGSGYVTQIAYHLFLKAGLIITAIPDGYFQAVNVALVTPRDVVVAISHSGETLDVVSALRLAQSRGATTVALTGNPQSTLTHYADIRIITASHEEPIYGDFMDAKIAQLFIIDVLYIGVLLRNIPMFTKNLNDTALAIWDRSGGPWRDWHPGARNLGK